MKREFKGIQRKGLPGGPHEQFTYVTGVFMQDMYHTPKLQDGNGENVLDEIVVTPKPTYNDSMRLYNQSLKTIYEGKPYNEWRAKQLGKRDFLHYMKGYSKYNYENDPMNKLDNLHLFEMPFEDVAKEPWVLNNLTDDINKQRIKPSGFLFSPEAKAVPLYKKPTGTPPADAIEEFQPLGLSNYMRVQGMDSSFDTRSKWAQFFNIKDYKGTAEQNVKLLKLLQEYKKKPIRAQKGGEGYRLGAEGYNDPYKIIPSGNITMTEKDGSPLEKGSMLGIDNLGNQQMMYPGYDYKFPGDAVMEIPMMQDGNGENEFEIPGLRNRMQYNDQGNKLYGYKSFMPRNAFGFVTPTEIDPLSKTPRGLFGAASYRFPKTNISAEGRVFQSLSQLPNKGQYDPSITDVELLAKYSPKPGLSVQAGPKLTTVGLPQGQTLFDPGYLLETTQSFPKLNLEGTLGLRQSFNRGPGVKGGLKYMPRSGNTFLTGEIEFDPSVFQGKQTPRVQLSATQKLGVRNKERPRSFEEMKEGGALPKYQISGPENIAQVQLDNLSTQIPQILTSEQRKKVSEQKGNTLLSDASYLLGLERLYDYAGGPIIEEIIKNPDKYSEALKTSIINMAKGAASSSNPMARQMMQNDPNMAIDNTYDKEALDLAYLAPYSSYLKGLRFGNPFKNVYKLNPFSNKLYEYNRIVGQDAVEDALKSNLIKTGRPKDFKKGPGKYINIDRRGATAFPSFGKKGKGPNDLKVYYNKILERGDTPYIISTNRPMKVSTLGRHGSGSTMFPVDESGEYLRQFPLSEATIYSYQPHWLMGYKKIKQEGGALPKYQMQGQTYDINKIANAINKGQANTLTSDELAYYKKNYAQGNIASVQDENLYGFLPEATVYADPIKPGRQISSNIANALATTAEYTTPFPAAVRIGLDTDKYKEALKKLGSDLAKGAAMSGSIPGTTGHIDPELAKNFVPQGGYSNELLDIASVASLLPSLRALRAQKFVPNFNIDPLSFKSLYRKKQANLANEIRRRIGLVEKGKASQSDIDFIFDNQFLQDGYLPGFSEIANQPSRASVLNQRIIDNFNRFDRTSMTRDDIVGSNTFFSNLMRGFPSSIKKTKTKIRNKSGLTKDEIKERYPDINVNNISDKDFGEMYLTSDNKLVKGSTEKQLKKELKKSGVSDLTPKEYQDIFNSNLDKLNQIIQKNKSSDAPFYKVVGLMDDAIIIESDFGRSALNVKINPGKMTGQVSDIANVDYIKGLPGMSMRNTTQGVYGQGNPVVRGTKLYDSLNEFLKEINLGRVKSGFSGKSKFSKGLWENLPKKNKGFTFYTNPSSIEGVMYKDGGTTAKKQLNSDLLKTYKNYINGVDESAEAVNAYDKLNRIFYKESKLNNMSAPNYIMTHIIPNA